MSSASGLDSSATMTGSATMIGVGIGTSVLGATIFFRIVLVLTADGSDSRSSTGLDFSATMMGSIGAGSGSAFAGTETSVTGTVTSSGSGTSSLVTAKYPSESMLSVSSTGSTCMFLNSSDSCIVFSMSSSGMPYLAENTRTTQMWKSATCLKSTWRDAAYASRLVVIVTGMYGTGFPFFKM